LATCSKKNSIQIGDCSKFIGVKIGEIYKEKAAIWLWSLCTTKLFGDAFQNCLAKFS
jgi:hypothetical protein